MAETVGSIDYEVSFDTGKLLKGQRDIDSQLKKTGTSFDKFGSSVSSTTNSLKPMAIAVAGLGAAMAAIGVASTKAADNLRLMAARVEIAAGSVATGAAAFDALYQISQRTQTAMEANVTVFTRLNSSIVQMGGSQADTLKMTELLAMAIKTSGANAQESQSAMMQFGQALGSGQLAGDELRSLLETAPYLMKQLAAGIGVPIGALKQLGADGKLTADVVVQAMGKAAGQIVTDFAKVPNTFESGYQAMSDSAAKFNEQLDVQSGFSAALTGVTVGLGEAFDLLTNKVNSTDKASSDLQRKRAIEEWSSGTVDALATVADMAETVRQTLTVLARNVAYVFKSVGDEIGGIGAQVAAVMRGDFAAASRIGDMMKSDAKAARAELDKADAATLSSKVFDGDKIRAGRKVSASMAGGGFSKLTPPKKAEKGASASGSSAAKSAAREAAKARADEEKKALDERAQMWTNSQQDLNDEMGLLQSGSDITAAFKGLDPVASLKAEYETKLAMVSQYEQLMAMQGVDATAEATAAKLEMERAYNEQKTIMDEARFRAQSEGNELMMASLDAFGRASSNALAGLLSGTMTVREAMAGLANTILNEAVGSLVQMGIQQIKTAAIGKSVAAANGAMYAGAVAAQVATNTALAGQAAFAATAAIPMVGPALAPAAAAAASAAAGAIGSPAIATAAAAGRKYGGPVSAGEMYRVGEGGKPEMFVGYNGENYMIPGKGGKVVGNNALSGGGTVVNITVNNDGSSTSTSGQNGAQLGRMIEGAVVAVISREKTRWDVVIMADFTFALSSAKQVTVAPRVKVARFGDGYAQRTQDGLNAQPEQWSLSLDNRPSAQVAAVVVFLSSHGGHTPFTWRGKKWICPSWSRQEHGRGIESVSFNIEQDFSL